MRNIQAKITNLPLTDRRFQKVTKIQSSSTPHLLSPLDMDHRPIDMTKYGDEFFSSDETWESPQHEKEHPLPNLHLLGSIPDESIILIEIAGWRFEPIYHQCTSGESFLAPYIRWLLLTNTRSKAESSPFAWIKSGRFSLVPNGPIA